MSLKIRLSRGGAKKRPFYRIVVADARDAARRPLHREARHLRSAEGQGRRDRLVLDPEKAKAWLAKGAQPTDRVLRLLDGLGLPSAKRRTIRKRPCRRRRRRSAPPRPRPPQPRPPKRPRPERGMSLPATAPDRLILMGVFGAPQGVRSEIGSNR